MYKKLSEKRLETITNPRRDTWSYLKCPNKYSNVSAAFSLLSNESRLVQQRDAHITERCKQTARQLKKWNCSIDWRPLQFNKCTFKYHKINSKISLRVELIDKGDKHVAASLRFLGHAPPYITSHRTHFLNVPHQRGIIGSCSMEGGLALRLQSPVRLRDEKTRTLWEQGWEERD